MRIFGLEITRQKAVTPTQPTDLSTINDRTWLNVVREPFPGAWQRNMEERAVNITAFHAVYACVTLIAADVSKIAVNLVEQNPETKIWAATQSPAFTPVLRKPNRYQTRIQFFAQWVISRLLAGNTYVLKQRDARGVVVALYILDPGRVRVLVAPDGAIYYELRGDNLAGLQENTVTIPASEIIHDVCIPLYHPLCGVSPVVACYAAAAQGLAIQANATKFFSNGSRPGGVISAPGLIKEDVAKRIKEFWDSNFTGANAGKVAVLGDGLKFEALDIVSAADSQMIEQLQWSAKTVCSCFHVPPFMIGIEATPAYNNVEALNQQYYSQCLQVIFESIELLLDEGLGLTKVADRILGTEFDLDNLLRMDTATKVKTVIEGLRGLFTPNEARLKFDLPPQEGGDSVYMQQQMFSLEALAKRDEQDDPFGTSAPAPAAPQDSGGGPNDGAEEDDPEEVQASVQLAAWELKSNLARLAGIS